MPIRRLFVCLGATALLVGCATGPRPTLGPPQGGTLDGPTGDVRVDALLARLDTVSDKTFTATYQITRLLGPIEASAQVIQAPPRSLITVGDTAFHLGDGNERTCSISTQACETGIIEQKLSDLAISSAFFSRSPATQIRVTFKRKDGDPQFATTAYAGVNADCVAIPVGAGNEQYCVAPNGAIAYVQRADVVIEMTAYVESADQTALG